MQIVLPKLHLYGFNTQPHEGGCIKRDIVTDVSVKFQHTAARRRLLIAILSITFFI